MKLFKGIVKDQNASYLKGLEPLVETINKLEPEISSLSDNDLKAKTKEFKNRIKEGETLDDILVEAFATVREVAKRTLGQRHFDVQLMGGITLHRGDIAEMRTGEGKTLVATLPAYLNALTEKGVHIVTVNDYLSRRDAVWMGQIYNFLGLSVGILNNRQSFLYDPEHKNLDEERDEIGSFKVVDEFLSECTRSEAYVADITYGTNSEFGFDYLRDNLEYEPTGVRQRKFNYAIVDEIDSILIDEARTPLIISAPTSESESLYKTFAGIAAKFKEEEDYTVDEKHKSIALTDDGISKAEKALGVDNLYTEKGIKYVHHLETAVRAKALFHNNKEYVIKEGEVVIVDEFTGRLQPGRQWSQGLHQAIEAKENVPIQKETKTYASITYQNYFRMYKNLAGMTGTAATSSEEFFKVYGLNTVIIPTNEPIARIDQDDLIFQTENGKFKAVSREVKKRVEKGQPVLIGTASVEKNEMLSDYLYKEGVKHEILNAKNHEREGEIIAQAGKRGAVTIATNMAGRGVDIKLGGNPTTSEKYEEVKEAGGLFVLGTERHEARRIDNQLRGRSGRQGDPGETQFFVSLEDSLMRVFASETMKKMMGRIGIPEDEPIKNRMITKSLENAQKKIEGFNFDARKHILEFDDVLNKQRTSIYETRRKILIGNTDEVEEYVENILKDASEETRKHVETSKMKIGRDAYFNMLRKTVLQIIDTFWVEHLETMDYMRSSVNLRAYGQRDPLIEYKKEGLVLFREMQEGIEQEIINMIPRVSGEINIEEPSNLREIHEGAKQITEQKAPTKKEKIGRNQQVTISNGIKTKTLKYKKAEPLLSQGWKVVSSS